MDERSFPSTTWSWRRVKVSPPPEARGQSARRAGRWFGRPPWPVRTPLHITVKYRGGPECWYEVHARGCIGRFPGHVALHDAIREIMRVE